MSGFIKLTKAADYLGLTPATLRRYVHDGKLTAHTINGGTHRQAKLFLLVNEVENLLQATTKERDANGQ